MHQILETLVSMILRTFFYDNLYGLKRLSHFENQLLPVCTLD